MLFGLDGVEISLIIVFACLFGAIMSGYPVAFAIGGAAIVSFGIIAALDSSGILVKEVIDTGSAEYAAVIAEGVPRYQISHFRYPDLPMVTEALLPGGWETAMDRNLSFIVNRMNERVLAGPSIETLLAVAMFVLMGITLERSRIANDLLTTMARIFGPLPGGLAVSVVVVGAFLAASTGIVGATVVTMGLLSLPTMLRNNYSPELATGVIAASGTLGQIIPPSIVIVLLGTLAGDLYATAQEERASLLGCSDALTYLGEAAVLSVGTLFQAAIIPGVFLAFLYGLYAFGYALFRPQNAPPIHFDEDGREGTTRAHKLTWFLGVPVALIVIAVGMTSVNIAGSQSIAVSSIAEQGLQAELRTNVGEQCKIAMIEKHGQEKWDRAVATQAEIDAAGGSLSQEDRVLSEDQLAEARAAAIEAAAPISTGLLTIVTFLALVLTTAYGVAPQEARRPLMVGGAGVLLALLLDIVLISPTTSSGAMFLLQAIPFYLIYRGLRPAVARLGQNDLLRVVFPPLVLIVAVLGSILGGITNPTPAAALGAGGAIMLAAYRKLQEQEGASGKIILLASFAMVIMLLIGVNFDLRANVSNVSFENWVAIIVALVCYHVAIGGLLYACWVLLKTRVLTPVVRETAKVTSMVFAILIGSQLLNLVVISFGGEHYIQEFLRSFDQEWVVFLIVMLVLFILGFVLDFLEIIYIVIPIVGPVIYGGTMDPKWVTIMIAVNLQTSFLTPPFGFALFYLRGVAPASVTTGHIYRGVIPFVLIQVIGLAILWFFPSIVTILPDLL
ncbi:TRAP transporter large permease [Oceanomicrobium pacificus]|uniref:TRAP transporter large permease subunit n=1 Tax=Oceanomicrobium pacificus TaxID=2692916 RepID=A0A6B0U5J4_9RHOB|nr:TRAP transporter large permease subunit [Oceanomicrobium pacificus]MXU66181.1 TRAP transporter large permease subunit [Oceanomicrobium pacificus]